MPRITFAFLCAAALAVSACGPTSTAQGQVAATGGITESTSTDSSTSADAPATDSSPASEAPPPPETSGTESAGPVQSGEPSISVAGLPIGNGGVDGNCLSVQFLHASTHAPDGVRLVVTDILFKPALVHTGGSDCSGSGNPACLEKFVPTPDQDVCDVAIQPVGEPDPAKSVEVSAVATVDCPPGRQQTCLDYRSTLENDHQTFRIDVPERPTVDSSTSDSSTGSSTSQSTTTDSNATTSPPEMDTPTGSS